MATVVMMVVAVMVAMGMMVLLGVIGNDYGSDGAVIAGDGGRGGGGGDFNQHPQYTYCMSNNAGKHKVVLFL